LRSLEDLERQSAVVVVEERSVSGGAWRITAKQGSRVLLPLQWWPEWTIEVDGEEAPYTNQRGLVAVQCPPGSVVARAQLRPSWSRWVGGVLSLLGCAALGFLLWFERRRR
jgi:hypothetical protein